MKIHELAMELLKLPNKEAMISQRCNDNIEVVNEGSDSKLVEKYEKGKINLKKALKKSLKEQRASKLILILFTLMGFSAISQVDNAKQFIYLPVLAQEQEDTNIVGQFIDFSKFSFEKQYKILQENKWKVEGPRNSGLNWLWEEDWLASKILNRASVSITISSTHNTKTNKDSTAVTFTTSNRSTYLMWIQESTLDGHLLKKIAFPTGQFVKLDDWIERENGCEMEADEWSGEGYNFYNYTIMYY